jgi:hypothetical protein
MYFLIFLVLLLAGSLGVLAWYIRNLLTYIRDLNMDIIEPYNLLSDYREHLETVYEADRFYGDATLEGLLTHTKSLIEELSVFVEDRNIFEETNESNDQNQD